MTATDSSYGNTLSLRALVLVSIAAGLAALYWLSGNGGVLTLSLITFVTDGGLAVLVFIAAGGYGDLIVSRLMPEDSPAGLRVATACGVGLWAIATLMLTVGSLTEGLLTGWVWWPIIGVGLIVAAWRGREFLEGHKMPRLVPGRALIWIVLAVAVAVWITGVTRPPQYVGAGADEYDVVEYHLQVPREYYDAGHIAPLPHNVYSHFPMGVEMLYLLGMCLRGGAYEGMYAAKAMHGLFAALAVLAILSSFRKDDVRGWASGVLLASTPYVLYLSWLGMVELAEVLYLTLALLWLRQWVRQRSAKSAACIGLALGGACAAKYLSVGFVVLPVAAMMVLLSLRNLQTLHHVGLAMAVTAALFSPWLIRNAATVDNPVFPLATSVFGSGDYWSASSPQRSAELSRRWVDGHAPDKRPPVPTPRGWRMPPQTSRLSRFYREFLSEDFFGPVTIVLAGVGLCMLVAVKGKADPWEWSLVGTAAVQLAVWVWGTHEMPSRFIVPVIVPVVLLVGGMLARIYLMQASPFARKTDPSGRSWGVVAASILFILAVGTNMAVALMATTHTRTLVNGARGRDVAESLRSDLKMPDGARPMLVGEARAFYFPSGTVYATAFNSHPLAEMIEQGLSAEEILAELQSRGITHLYVNWFEIIRLAGSYGCPASLADEPMSLLPEGQFPLSWKQCLRLLTGQPRLTVLEEMKSLGLREVPLDIFLGRLPIEPKADTPPSDDGETLEPATDDPAQPAAAQEGDGPAEDTPAAHVEQRIQLITVYALPGVGDEVPPGPAPAGGAEMEAEEGP